MSKKREQEKPLGLECPACGCRHFIVTNTEPLIGEIRRRRECRNCGRKIVTRESRPGGPRR